MRDDDPKIGDWIIHQGPVQVMGPAGPYCDYTFCTRAVRLEEVTDYQFVVWDMRGRNWILPRDLYPSFILATVKQIEATREEAQIIMNFLKIQQKAVGA